MVNGNGGLMSGFDYEEPPKYKILNIMPLIQNNKRKECNCKNRTFEVDSINRLVYCRKCGQVVDAFEAIEELLKNDSMFEQHLSGQYEYAKELTAWFHNHKEPIALKEMLSYYRRGLYPYCPACGKMIDLSNIKMWGNKEFLNRPKTPKP